MGFLEFVSNLFCVYFCLLALLLQLKPVRSLESFKHSDGSGNDNDWVNPSVPFLIAPQRKQNDALAPSPNKTPPNIPPRTICPQLFPSNGYDIFGATPFVMSDNSFDGDSVFLVASPSSVDMVRLPPPAHNSSSRKCKVKSFLIFMEFLK